MNLLFILAMYSITTFTFLIGLMHNPLNSCIHSSKHPIFHILSLLIIRIYFRKSWTYGSTLLLTLCWIIHQHSIISNRTVCPTLILSFYRISSCSSQTVWMIRSCQSLSIVPIRKSLGHYSWSFTWRANYSLWIPIRPPYLIFKTKIWHSISW